ncbi:MAG TPA: glycosyltransferase family 2 protein [Candidatus Methylomirabilis sp.]|nr:glycosyltransferase family 2 protein [Candidatus Methylomirabilis sp.]
MAAKPAPRIALATTVKNEAALLRSNILYHRYLGVDRFFVYADDPADGTLETVADLPFVCARPSVPIEQFDEHPAFALEVAHYENLPSRQVLNAFDAMARAREAGADWLVHLDPDELICLDVRETRPDQLRARLSTLDPAVEAAWFPPLEVVQTGAEASNIFEEAVVFKRPLRTITRRVPDPITGAMVTVPSYYGHTEGKSAVRLTANAKPVGPHRFRRMNETPLRTSRQGYVLHYYAYSFEDFHKKFSNMRTELEVFPRGGTMPVQKRLWKRMVNEAQMSREALEGYYRRWVVLSPEDVARWRRWGKVFGLVPLRRSALVEVRSVQRAWPAVGQTRKSEPEEILAGGK